MINGNYDEFMYLMSTKKNIETNKFSMSPVLIF